jgi:hypothetical protein
MKFRSNQANYNTKTGVILIDRKTLRAAWKESETSFEADLYKTKKENYFLVGKGQVLTLFNGAAEERILPITREEAQRIAKAYMKESAYREEFGV